MNWTFLFAAVNWTSEHRAFIMETFIKTNESVTATPRAFRLHFNLGRHDPAAARNTIFLWVTNLRAAGSALNRKSTGLPRITRSPENVTSFENDFDSMWTIMDPI